MVVDDPAPQVPPKIILPAMRKCFAPAPPSGDAPSASKLQWMSHSSLVQRTPSLMSSTSSHRVLEDPPSIPVLVVPAQDLLIMRLNMMEQSIHRNHQAHAKDFKTLRDSLQRDYEEALGRIAEVRVLYERQLEDA